MSTQNHLWSVCLTTQTATHDSGFSIAFTGAPETSYFEGTPSAAGKVSNLEFIALLREGFRVYRETYINQKGKSKPVSPGGRKPVIVKKPSRKRLMEPCQ